MVCQAPGKDTRSDRAARCAYPQRRRVNAFRSPIADRECGVQRGRAREYRYPCLGRASARGGQNSVDVNRTNYQSAWDFGHEIRGLRGHGTSGVGHDHHVRDRRGVRQKPCSAGVDIMIVGRIGDEPKPLISPWVRDAEQWFQHQIL